MLLACIVEILPKALIEPAMGFIRPQLSQWVGRTLDGEPATDLAGDPMGNSMVDAVSTQCHG
ncbi:hypothetical protein DO97_08495 [Neosynechococcus sphagnicola sy1]|uniref:Uncharacterized protein n=1 Tax=Neosynechococcus sphagnicola sy1 TaxID=1497020 RepID=A0A098TNK4_9CYAN|nr:hypothetical protein DO97_08495 [Neosynechococcus sphagnicola sy1]